MVLPRRSHPEGQDTLTFKVTSVPASTSVAGGRLSATLVGCVRGSVFARATFCFLLVYSSICSKENRGLGEPCNKSKRLLRNRGSAGLQNLPSRVNLKVRTTSGAIPSPKSSAGGKSRKRGPEIRAPSSRSLAGRQTLMLFDFPA
jgi:hypothetical protein